MKQVITSPAIKRVIANSAIEKIIAAQAPENVIASHAIDGVIATSGSGRAGEVVRARSASCCCHIFNIP
jgi:hypothetical protein